MSNHQLETNISAQSNQPQCAERRRYTALGHDSSVADLTALRQSEEKYRTIFSSMNDGVVVGELLYDNAGRPFDLLVLETNPSFDRMMRTTNTVGKRASEIFADAKVSWVEVYRCVVETGESLRLESYFAPLGSWFELYILPTGDANRHRLAILCKEITRYKQLEQELTKTKQLFQATFDSAVEEIQLLKAVRDEYGVIVDFEWLMSNKQWNDQWGEMAGKRLLEENPGVVETGLFDKFKQVIESGVTITHEQYYAHEQFNGWFLQTIAKVGDGFLTSTLNITERKRREANLAFLAEISQDLVYLRCISSWGPNQHSGKGRAKLPPLKTRVTLSRNAGFRVPLTLAPK